MKTFICFFPNFLSNETGAAAVEYALLISCIAAVIAGSVGVFGHSLLTLYEGAINKFPK
jgi:Flp pilus assembly pilin Flp